MKNSQARTGHQRGRMGGRETDDDGMSRRTRRGARLLAVAGWWLGFVCHPRTPLETEQPPTPPPARAISFRSTKILLFFSVLVICDL